MIEEDLYNFLLITNDILINENFIKLKKEKHHGNNRYDHCLRVALKMYKAIPNNDPNKARVVRASLLHDFFYRSEMPKLTPIERYKYHPAYSIKNSIINFNIGKLEREIIRTHMFPLTNTIPRNKYAWKLAINDKLISIKETFKYRLFHIDDNIEYIDLTKNKFNEKEILNLPTKYNDLISILEYNNDII